MFYIKLIITIVYQTNNIEMAVQCPVFVAILSDNCAYSCKCMVYYEKLAEHLKEEYGINVVTITARYVHECDFDRYHPKLKPLVQWTPNFFLFTHDAWNNHTNPLVGDVFNGRFGADGATYYNTGSTLQVSFDTLTEWVKSSLVDEKYYIQTKPSR